MPNEVRVADYLKSVLPELFAEGTDPDLERLTQNRISTVGAVRGCRESDLVNLGLSPPVLGYLLKVKNQ